MRKPLPDKKKPTGVPRWTWITMIIGLVLALIGAGVVGILLIAVGGVALLFYALTAGRKSNLDTFSIEERTHFDRLTDRVARPKSNQTIEEHDDVVDGDWRKVDDPITHRDPRPPYIPYPETEEWDKLRRTVYKRDKYTCVNCHRSGVKIVAHHVVPLQSGGSNQLSNLITFCWDCHALVHPHLKNK